MPASNTSYQIQVDPLDLVSKTDEERIQLALDAIARNGFKENGRPWLSIREAARCFEVRKTTLTARFNGRKTKKEAHLHERALSFGEEDALVKWVSEMGRRGIPLHATAVAQHASVISGRVMGERWVYRFRARHPELKVKWSTGLEQCRAQSLNSTAVSGFYDNLEDLVEKYNIPEENIYNMDEKGIQLGMGKRVLAFVDRDQKTVHQVEDGNRELVTVIECVCADGTAIPPSVVFKGARRDLEWGRNNPCDARYVCPIHSVTSVDTYLAFRTHRRAGQTRSSDPLGSSVTSNLQQPPETSQVVTASLF
jgi:hypothetical protein